MIMQRSPRARSVLWLHLRVRDFGLKPYSLLTCNALGCEHPLDAPEAVLALSTWPEPRLTYKAVNQAIVVLSELGAPLSRTSDWPIS